MSAPAPRRPAGPTAVLVGAGIVALVLLLLFDDRAAHASLLVALAATAWIIVGALLLVLLMHTVEVRPLWAYRRLAETVAACAPVLVLLVVPLALGYDQLYAWADEDPRVVELAARTVEWRRAYASMPPLLVRGAIYIAIWTALALLLRRWSLRQDAASSARRSRPRGLAAVGLILLAVTALLATVDWVLALTPGWSMLALGFYFVAGGLTAALALLAVLSVLVAHVRTRAGDDATSRSDALGRMLLLSIGVWAYLGYAQLLLVWIADLPREVGAIGPRLGGGWGLAGLFVLVGHLVPAAMLAVGRIRRSGPWLVLIGAWLLAMHYFDVYWLAMPSVYPFGPAVGWSDPIALIGVAGLAGAAGLLLARGHALVPTDGAQPDHASAASADRAAWKPHMP